MAGLWMRLGPLLAFLLVGGCAVDPSGLGSSPVNWSVSPLYFCAGDTVRTNWDLSRLSRSPDLCLGNFGGYPELRLCESASECEGGSCLDGVCCRPEGGGSCPTTRGCLGPHQVSLTADTLAIEPPVDRLSGVLVGSRDTVPEATTRLEFNGFYSPPLTRFERSQTVTLVTPLPPTSHTMRFRLACIGSRANWLPVDLDSPQPFASANVHVVGVRNTSGRRIRLSATEPGRGPVDLTAGGTSDAFNGPFAGRWTASLGAVSRPQSCDPTFLDSELADLEVEVLLECIVQD